MERRGYMLREGGRKGVNLRVLKRRRQKFAERRTLLTNLKVTTWGLRLQDQDRIANAASGQMSRSDLGMHAKSTSRFCGFLFPLSNIFIILTTNCQYVMLIIILSLLFFSKLCTRNTLSRPFRSTTYESQKKGRRRNGEESLGIS